MINFISLRHAVRTGDANRVVHLLEQDQRDQREDQLLRKKTMADFKYTVKMNKWDHAAKMEKLQRDLEKTDPADSWNKLGLESKIRQSIDKYKSAQWNLKHQISKLKSEDPWAQWDRLDTWKLNTSPLATGKGNSLLHFAVQCGQSDIAQILMGYGAYVNAKDTDGMLPLDHAIEKHDLVMADLLISHGAAFNGQVRLIKGPTLLDRAIEKLMSYGAHIPAPDNEWTYVGVALEKITNFLMWYNTPVSIPMHIQNNIDKKPVYRAIEQDDIKMVTLLIERGAYIHGQDNEGSTPLHIAAKKCNPAIIELLIKHGVSPTVQDDEGMVAFNIANKCDPETKKLLMYKGMNLNDIYKGMNLNDTPTSDDDEAFVEIVTEPNHTDVFVM